MEGHSPRVICSGVLCLDLIPTIETKEREGEFRFEPGRLFNIGPMQISTGGSVSNTGISFSVFGNEMYFFASVGDDQFSDVVMNILRKYGNVEGIKIVKNQHTAYSTILALKNQDRIILHHPGTNFLYTSKDVDFELVEKIKPSLFHLGYPSLLRSTLKNNGDDLRILFERIKQIKGSEEKEIIVSVDMSLPDESSLEATLDWRKIYSNILPKVDFFFPSVEESFFTLFPKQYLELKAKCGVEELLKNIPIEKYREMAEILVSNGTKCCVIKGGEYGAYIKVSEDFVIGGNHNEEVIIPREFFCPSFLIQPGDIKSACGAGDAFVAGFMSCFLRNGNLLECMKMANGAGYCNLLDYDSYSGLKSWNETIRLVKHELKCRDLKEFMKGNKVKFDLEKKIYTFDN